MRLDTGPEVKLPEAEDRSGVQALRELGASVCGGDVFITKWNAELLIGIPSIDQQHRQLVELLTEAYVGFVIGINIEKHVVDEVITAMTTCFECEESWMISKSYPGFFEHKKEHEFFRQRLLEISRSYQQDANTSIDVLIFLNNWVNHHIRLTDAKLGAHL